MRQICDDRIRQRAVPTGHRYIGEEDRAQVDGIDVQVAQTVIAEVGVDLDAFSGERNFASWLGLCPTNDTSGGKVLNRLPAGSFHAHPESKLLRRTISPPADPVGSAQSHHGDGSQACLPVLPATQTRPAVRRQRRRILRTTPPEQQVRFVTQRAKQLGLQVVTPEPTNA